MLGRTIADPEGIEGRAGTSDGLGLLNVDTVMTPKKALTKVCATDRDSGQTLSGYEIHIGMTQGPDCARAPFEVAGRAEGAASAGGLVVGSYLHGLFATDAYRAAFLRNIGAKADGVRYSEDVDITLDALAAHLEAHLDLDAMLSLAREVG